MNKQFEKVADRDDTLVVFDMDGTLTEARWGKETILSKQCHDAVNTVAHLNKDYYEEVKPIKAVLDEALRLDTKGEVKVLSLVHDGVEVVQKIKCLSKLFRKGMSNDFIGVASLDEKFEVLEYFTKHYKNVVYVDDYLDVLIDMEKKSKEKNLKGLSFFHVSSLLV